MTDDILQKVFQILRLPIFLSIVHIIINYFAAKKPYVDAVVQL